MIQEETENKNPSKTVTEIEILNNEKLKKFNSTHMFYEHSQKCQYLIYVHIILRYRKRKYHSFNEAFKSKMV